MRNLLSYFGIGIALVAATLSGAAIYLLAVYSIDLSPLAYYNPGSASVVLDDEGKEWTRFMLDKREPMSLSAMPKHVQHAFLAAEDWQFFSHNGISFKGIFRSTLVNLASGKKMQGASTITQQLVKLLFLDSQKTFTRKFKEQLYAILVERQFTKEQILEIYLNHIYFGCGIYGVEAASQRFWGKSVKALSIDEAATLAAVIRSPALYCPLLNPANTIKRRNIILQSMKKLHFITDEQYTKAVNSPLVMVRAEHEQSAEHAREYIRQLLEQRLGRQRLYTGGLTIKTTLNSRMQENARMSFKTIIQQLREDLADCMDGALMSIEVHTGAIKAIVGGFDFKQSQFNRALQAKRQIGSVFKPLIYAAALASGKHFYDTAVDEPLTIEIAGKAWQPHNYDNNYEGAMTLARALTRSNNIIAIKTLQEIGFDALRAITRACDLDEIPSYPSLALGCIDMTLMQAVGIFNIFANHGIYVKPYLIEWVKDDWGIKIIKHEPSSRQAMPSWIADSVAKVLELGIKRWRTIYKKEFIASDVISKTGTTNESRTCWFAGSTPEITTVAWTGCDDNRPLETAFPFKTAFPIWVGLHTTLNQERTTFEYDKRLKPIYINEWTGRYTWPTDTLALEIFA